MSLIEYPETGYNSWCDEDFAFEYFETRLNSDAWDALSNKEPVLITAFRSLAELNLNISFDDNGIISSDVYTDTEAETILTALKQAQCEQALHELRHDLDQLNIKSLGLGGLLNVKINSDKEPPRHSERALAILRPYIEARIVTRTR